MQLLLSEHLEYTYNPMATISSYTLSMILNGDASSLMSLLWWDGYYILELP